MQEDYHSPQVDCASASWLEPAEGEALIGKQIARVEASEYALTLYFTDGSNLDVRGHTYEDSALKVDLNPAPEPSL